MKFGRRLFTAPGSIFIIFCVGFFALAYFQYFAYAKDTPDSVSDPPAKFMSDFMFFAGIFVLAAICGGIFALIISMLPKRIRRCPVKEFVFAKQILIPLADGKNIVVMPDSPEFSTIIKNFSNEKRSSDYDVCATKIYLKIRHKRYAIQVSLEGWNFLGEPKGCRRLHNAIELMRSIETVQER